MAFYDCNDFVFAFSVHAVGSGEAEKDASEDETEEDRGGRPGESAGKGIDELENAHIGQTGMIAETLHGHLTQVLQKNECQSPESTEIRLCHLNPELGR